MHQQQPAQTKVDAALALLLSRLPDATSYIVVARIGDRVEMNHKGFLGDLMVLSKLVEHDSFKKQFEVK